MTDLPPIPTIPGLYPSGCRLPWRTKSPPYAECRLGPESSLLCSDNGLCVIVRCLTRNGYRSECFGCDVVCLVFTLHPDPWCCC